jgi:Predicted transcriptional regulator with C-terminal CBS domains
MESLKSQRSLVEDLSLASDECAVEKHPDLVALGQAVRRLRREADLTQEELAARAGISANYVGEIERGEIQSKPTRDVRACARTQRSSDKAARWN